MIWQTKRQQHSLQLSAIIRNNWISVSNNSYIKRSFFFYNDISSCITWFIITKYESLPSMTRVQPPLGSYHQLLAFQYSHQLVAAGTTLLLVLVRFWLTQHSYVLFVEAKWYRDWHNYRLETTLRFDSKWLAMPWTHISGCKTDKENIEWDRHIRVTVLYIATSSEIYQFVSLSRIYNPYSYACTINYYTKVI